ncbi:hypothetical protein BCEN4_820016 [Burkholderia cenocepacia]|nr:hypothetical protein BCEN4_820016 [Burkholderia cenocepacia]
MGQGDEREPVRDDRLRGLQDGIPAPVRLRDRRRRLRRGREPGREDPGHHRHDGLTRRSAAAALTARAAGSHDRRRQRGAGSSR